MNTQRRIYEAVKARGYREGWTAEQFIARNVAKMQEELFEASELVALSDENCYTAIALAAALARREFDNGDWTDTGFTLPFPYQEEAHADFKGELADMYVVLCCMAEALGEMDGEAFSLEDAALAKSERDIDRGIRSEQ